MTIDEIVMWADFAIVILILVEILLMGYTIRLQEISLKNSERRRIW